MPTFRHGKNTVFKLDDSGGTLTDISTYLSDVGFPQSADLLETTTFGASDKTYITGFKDSSLSLSGRWDATIDAHLAGVLGQEATLSFEYGPEGSTTGRVKYTGEAILTSYDRSSSVGDVTGFTADLQVVGAVTRSTYA